ncbi:tRNA modification GTPase GTPBP3, mitochondrial [Thrips palmi]|uniref:tRNA modification GTPase GTPBP3, mitochondrial n=1 Tax=Thrips palmi TaxID=161013 RepID=A0A6P8ZUT4_THRPL|nr:tRNA modification GTPase GTPBP3, mitochondrial [Thrips palmi]
MFQKVRAICKSFACREFNVDLSRSYSAVGRTIFALSSGRGKSGVAVVRVSGSQSRVVLSAIADETCLRKPRFAQLRTLRDPQSNDILDKAIVIWFPGPKSFTGEDICEFQVHGGLAVVSGLLHALGKMPGLYPADPGEFSKRAFFNGSMDLTEAEGLADLIHAETEMQRKQALHQMGGSLHILYNRWRTVLLQNLAHVEAYIDFSEDENIEDDVMANVIDSLRKLSQEVETHLTDGRRGQRLRDGVQATIVGEPNVGKSSLLNLLCDRPAAIVTAIAGTTRDVVEQYINIGGYPLSIADTAGIRGESTVNDVVEKEGIARAKQYAKSADVILLVIDSETFLSASKWQEHQDILTFQEFVKSHMLQLGLKDFFNGQPCILKSNQEGSIIDSDTQLQCLIIMSKIDLIMDESIKKSLNKLQTQFLNVVVLSCLNGDGLPALLQKLESILEYLCGNPSQESPALSQVRHQHHLIDCLENIQDYLKKTSYLSEAQKNASLEGSQITDLAICAEDLRRAVQHLGKITGHVTTEQILDVIFRDFCIGK